MKTDLLARFEVLPMLVWLLMAPCAAAAPGDFCEIEGSDEWQAEINQSFRSLKPPASGRQGEYLILCYDKANDTLFEGGSWRAIWAQNQTGMHFWTPFMDDFFLRAQNNAFSYWFDHQFDGVRAGAGGETPPSGALAEDVQLDAKISIDGQEVKVTLKQIHDGEVKIPKDRDPFAWEHNYDGATPNVFWAAGTALAVVCKADTLLISRNKDDLDRYLTRIERAVGWLESKVDPKIGLVIGGAEQVSPFDGTHLISSVNVDYVAALDFAARLEELAGRQEMAALFRKQRARTQAALGRLQINGRSFIKNEDREGNRHGVYGAKQFGYYESWANVDAICYGVVDDPTARRIYEDIAAIPKLRPFGTLCTNYPGRDGPRWAKLRKHHTYFGRAGNWMNGGGWGPADARAMIAYFRMGAYSDALRLEKRVQHWRKISRMPDHLDEWGGRPSRKGCNIDYFAVFGAFLRGLFEYEYRADALILRPHLPPEIKRYRQLQPIRWGDKRLFVEWEWKGDSRKITNVTVNGQPLTQADPGQVVLPYDKLAKTSNIKIVCE